jgi:acyl dehydratase
MIGLYYEDHQVGQTAPLGAYRFTREAIVDFARQFDPQPFHLDEAAAAKSIFGGLCASGWHTVSVSMRLLVDGRYAQRATAAARGEKPPPLGLGKGVRDLRWSAPVRPGDVIAFSLRVESMRDARRPQWGQIDMRIVGVNQEGREVCAYTLTGLAARRSA